MMNAGRADNKAAVVLTKILLLQLLDYFAANWNDTQINDSAEMIATEYYWMSQAEFKLFTVRAKMGHFGTDYNKLSPQRLMKWLEEFSGECLAARADMHAEFDRAKTRDDHGAIDVSERLSAAVKDMFNKIDIKNKAEADQRESRKTAEIEEVHTRTESIFRKISEMNEASQSLLNDFNNIKQFKLQKISNGKREKTV